MKSFLSHYQQLFFNSCFLMTLAAMLLFFGNCSKDTTKPPLPPPPNIPDTTSHNFTWQTYSFGYGNASILKDVFIINKNDIWAVGEIHVLDSLGQDVAYNAAHWNGVNWELKVFVKTTGYPIPSIRGIWAINFNHIWLAAGSIYLWNGDQAVLSYQRDINTSETVEHLWSASGTEIYGAGNDGLIVYYNGSDWQRIESGTNTNINDVWGVRDESSSHSTVLATVSDRAHEGEYRLLSLSSNSAKDTLNWTLQRRLFGVWFHKDSPVYVCGSGVRIWKDNQWEEISLPNYFSTRVRGSASNNIFVVGAFGLFAHYNGSTWHVYDELFLPNGSLEGLAVRDDVVVAVGYVDNHDVLIMGRREQ